MTNAGPPSTWAPLSDHNLAQLQEQTLEWAIGVNHPIAERLQPLANDFLNTGALPAADLIVVRFFLVRRF